MLEIDNWARAGYNALGIKGWQAAPGEGSQASVLVVAQAANVNERQTWTFGPRAQDWVNKHTTGFVHQSGAVADGQTRLCLPAIMSRRTR
ncbi:unnamed protein product [Parajaminaea phylloscopi]